MHQFEYFRINDNEIEPLKALFILKYKDNNDWILQLNGINFLGSDGWELVNIIEQRVQFPEFIFKRQLKDWVRTVQVYNETLNDVRKESRKYTDSKYRTTVSKSDGQVVI